MLRKKIYEVIGLVGSITGIISFGFYFFPVSTTDAQTRETSSNSGNMSIGDNNSGIAIGGQNNTVTIAPEKKTSGKLNVSGLSGMDIPEDFLYNIKPGTPIDFVKEVMGSPRKSIKGKKRWVSFIYNFNNAYVQIDTKDAKTVSAVSVALTDNKAKIKISPLDYTIGGKYSESGVKYIMNETSIGEILKENNNGCRAPEINVAARNQNGYTVCYFGRPGAYNYYIIGSERMKIPDYDERKKYDWRKSIVDYVVVADSSDLDDMLNELHFDGVGIFIENRY